MTEQTFADELHDLTIDALDDCTEIQRQVFMLAHGITREGTTEALTVGNIARTIGREESTVKATLAYAEAKVYRAINLDLVRRELDRRADVMFGPERTDGLTQHDATIRYHVASDGPRGVTLGPGSEAMVSAAKYGGERTRSATIAAHQRYATGGRT
jgi:hypothetical protein